MHGSDDSDIPLVKALQEIEKRKANVKTSLRDRSGGWSRRQESAEDELDDEDIDDSGGISSGWFPEIFTRAPSPLEMASMQAMMLGTAGQNAGKGAIDILAPPQTWKSKDKPDPLNALLVDLTGKSDERGDIEKFFKDSLRDSVKNLKAIQSVKRVESLSLWQSYVAKKMQLETRALAEGRDKSYAEAYEQVWMFHGTAPDVIPKIYAQGFNRSFCGKNAVVYGKGVCKYCKYHRHEEYLTYSSYTSH